MTAKEIADLARSTNLTDEDAVDAFVDTLSARVAARRNTGENVDMERALREAASVAREAAVRLGKALDVCAHETARVAALTRSESGKVNRWDLEHLSAPQHDAGLYSAAFAAWESMVDLFESVADLVRGTDAEKAEALAKRAADKAAIVAVAPKAKSRKKSRAPKETAMGSVGTHYNDADRVRLATRRGNTMLGPSEREHCDHGKIYSFRWTWRVGETPETGECEYISQRCKKCGPPAED